VNDEPEADFAAASGAVAGISVAIGGASFRLVQCTRSRAQ
jgi:hypothetical protein